jgi:FKBP-type peptidyl-prolyl cis-trans isomerase FklB
MTEMKNLIAGSLAAALIFSSATFFVAGNRKGHATDGGSANGTLPANAGSEVVTPTKASTAVSMDDVSYSIGYSIGRNMTQQSVDLRFDAFADGLKAAIGESKARLTESEMQEVMIQFQQEMMRKEMEERESLGVKARKASEQYLGENKAKEGVVTTDSGLQYEVVKSGDGPMPKADDTVTVHYKGTLPDGTVFDSSYERGEPATFPVTGVIPGWTEALQLMHEGDKWRLVVPSELAYGPRGAGQRIGPHQVLVFDVELIKVNQPTSSDKVEEAPATESPS